MTTMKRRDFLNAAAVAAGGAVLGERCLEQPAWACRRAGRDASHAESGMAKSARRKWRSCSRRPACPATACSAPKKASGPSTSPAAAATHRDDARCTCRATRERLLREISPEGTGPSGIGVDEDNRTIWIGSTYSREIIRADAKTGETIEKHFTPGAGVIYQRTTDMPAAPGHVRRDRCEPRRRARRSGAQAAARRRWRPRCRAADRTRTGHGDGLGVGRGGAIAGNPGPPAPGTGAHGQQTQNGKLWMAVPPGRMIYRMDPKTWTVEHMFPTVGFRPHGIGIETPDAKHLWESDTNMGAFFKRDMVTGEVVGLDRSPGRIAVSARHVGLEGLHLLGRRHRRR